MPDSENRETPIKSPRIWVLHGARTGDNQQVSALAKALGWVVEEKFLDYSPACGLPHFLIGATPYTVKESARTQLRPPWPDIVIASGRRSVAPGRWIKQQSGNRAKLVQLGRPRAPLHLFDLVITTAQYGLPDAETAGMNLRKYERTEGLQAMISALMDGQFSDPKGFSFGGSQRTWSANALSKILKAEKEGPEAIAVIDFHTGVGPYGAMTSICLQDGEAAARAKNWLGPETMTPYTNVKDQHLLHPASGHPTEEYERIFAEREITSLIVEFGILAPDETLPMLLKEHRMTRNGADEAELKVVRQLVWVQHAPADINWQQAVLQQGLPTIDRVLQTLSGGNML